MAAPSDVQDFLASQPDKAAIANLFTFTLLSGPAYTFTDWRRPITTAGVTFLPGPPRLVRGTISVGRGTSVSTQKVSVQEANAEFIGLLAQGYFNRALYTMQRVFSAGPGQPWTSAMMRFAGRVNSIDSISRTSAEITVKCMLDDLDQDFPFEVVETDCDASVFDGRCGLSAASYMVTGTAAASCTKNALLSGLTNPDIYFTQGVVTFTSGVMKGFGYMVKKYVGGVITPTMPFLVPPVAGTTFSVTPGCDKTLATCESKYGYNSSTADAPFFRGTPFVPDPTVTY
jgi:uncharacterized phage protein (TIGR02218 family)